MVSIRVMNAIQAICYTYSNHPKTLMISIRNKGQEIPFFKKDNMIIYYFDFDDVEDGDPNGVAISKEQAQEIAKIVKDNHSINNIVVHCGAGISRSAGVAAAIGKAINNDDSFIFDDLHFKPNKTCYRRVLKAFGLINKGDAFRAES